uniref:Uncharacterized protein n=1 Tax=Rhizophora mucronata TaxID=61149 RepID=A0A2P2NTS8_RHIMU
MFVMKLTAIQLNIVQRLMKMLLPLLVVLCAMHFIFDFYALHLTSLLDLYGDVNPMLSLYPKTQP